MGSSEALWSLWMGKDEVQLSLGALLFPLTALVFPASRLPFRPCVTFTGGLCKGGLGEEKEFSGNPCGAEWGAQAARVCGNPGSLCTLFFAELQGRLYPFSFEWSLTCATDYNSWMEFWQNN